MRRSILVAFVSIVIGSLAGMVSDVVRQPSSTHGALSTFERTRAADQKRSVAVVSAWLEEQRKGREGKEFWLAKPWVQPMTFFAVRAWEFVDFPSPRTLMVRIESSNRAGQPVIILRKVHLTEHDGELLIDAVEDPVADSKS